ncbi:hypothetical protein DL546_009627 [Coniochaeta pulveracea]|uniref:HECT-type E3 ubiquitin transferase n=1 Tax=Coniochaeta pulveracea TaxID=177199 RepID=A0A420YLI7_9PEZI|nr:hypothetical protein DL546_009627 [Coniochaeta pulveracea]
MTWDTARPATGFGGLSDDDFGLLSGLWEHAPFARLPADAPAEFKDLVEDIENPKRVYAVHRASRRHNFQLLVQKYIVQLRDGCGCSYCTTSTCFTSRRRLAGKAPIRRYNTTSARTLAIYLASQDNPERGLCPGLRQPRGPPAALGSLLFVPNKTQVRHDGASYGSRSPPPQSRRSSLGEGTVINPPSSHSSPDGAHRQNASPQLPENELHPGQVDEARLLSDMPFSIRDRPVTKDYRSFAANVFGTVAFKMLEWLTPGGVEDMTRHADQFQAGPAGTGVRQQHSAVKTHRRKASAITKPLNDLRHQDKPDLSREQEDRPHTTIDKEPGKVPKCDGETSHSAQNGEARRTSELQEPAGGQEDPATRSPPSLLRPGSPRRNSTAKVRTSVPKRQLSIDTYKQEPFLEETPYSTLVRSPRLSHNDKSMRPLKVSNGSIPRPISQLTTAGFFDDVSLERMPPPKAIETRGSLDHRMTRASSSSKSSSPRVATPKTPALPDASLPADPAEAEGCDLDTPLETFYPQTLSRLNPDIVDLVCDVLQEDGTTERHMLEPQAVDASKVRQPSRHKSLQLYSSNSGLGDGSHLSEEWRLFVEQSLFYILSDPQRVLLSFTKKGSLYDSQTIWYCMLRLTRVAPTLVFHSLWMASAALFAPPKAAQTLRSPTAKLFASEGQALSNTEAGCLLSICLHALVAAAPLVLDSQQIYDMSRIRAHGLSLAGSGAIAKQPVDLCLQYDDAFSHGLAIRLARRLFTAITTRRCFDEVNDANLPSNEEQDILIPLLSHLDLLSWPIYILDFSVKDRAQHEIRVTSLLLDWARAVMLHDWSGSPEIPGNSPIGGALALIEAMYQKRQTLILGDLQFRSEYFAERLDAVEMPVAWLSHTGTRDKLHLLDFPFLFNPATLVSYFRAINFSRMSRAYEESNSLEQYTDMIISRGSLGLTHHYKQVLTDMMGTATSKYLLLSVRRDSVIKDAFDQLWRREERELLRPLKVRLGEDEGEEGFDSGGVQQEFFRLAIAEILNPEYGAFTTDERSRMAWFRPGSVVELWQFELIGLIVSLAVYNGITLPVTFPKALYRKLLGEPVTELHHIMDGWRDLASSLTQLLEWDEKDGLVEDIFVRTYEFSVEAFNGPVTQQMTSDPSSWPQFRPGTTATGGEPSAPPPAASATDSDEAPLVTSSNRNAYVYDYIRYLTDISIRPQYEAFARGFRTCFHPKSLTLLTPSTLQSLVEGVQEIDIAELRRYTRYNDYDASHRTIKDFWSIVKKYDEGMKRRLLEFVTASDRLPVGGVKNLQFTIQRNGEEGTEGRLPTAYTCYGILLLPVYESKEVLREKLAMALEHAQGFGFA